MARTKNKIAYRDGANIVRWVNDTAHNRAKYAGRIIAPGDLKRGRKATPARSPRTPERPSVPDRPPTDPPVDRPTVPSTSQAAGDDAAREKVRDMLSGGGSAPGGAPTGPGSAPGAGPGSEYEVSYAELLKVVNAVLILKAPKFQMEPQEVTAIGIGVDAVIAKHFPNLKNAGPEFALAAALLAYAVRVFLPVIMGPARSERPAVVPDATPKPENMPRQPNVDPDLYAGVDGERLPALNGG
jgi:hypothetical protein